MTSSTPKFQQPKLHQFGALASYEHWAELKNSYNEVLHLNHCQHMSINIYNNKDELLILSANPNIGQHLAASNTLRYDGTTSPSFYANRDFFWWEQAYEAGKSNIIKANKEWKYGLTDGIILSRKLKNYHVVYSFGFNLQKNKDPRNTKVEIEETKKQFINMGNHCFSQIKHIAEHYLNDDLPDLSQRYLYAVK